MSGHSYGSGRRRSRRSGWQRRLSRVMGYLLACSIGIIGVAIAMIGLNAGGRSDDPAEVWAGLIIGAILLVSAIVWLICLLASYSRRY